MSLDNDVLMGLILPAAFSLASLVTHQATSQLQLQVGWWLVSSRVDASKQPPQPRVAARRRTNQPTNSKFHIRCWLAFTNQPANSLLGCWVTGFLARDVATRVDARRGANRPTNSNLTLGAGWRVSYQRGEKEKKRKTKGERQNPKRE